MDPDGFESLECDGCGGVMQVRYVGRLHDKRATCPYCGTEVDLPDSFRRVQRRREHERHSWGDKTVESELVEMRSDRLPSGEVSGTNSELDEILEALQALDLDSPDDQLLQELQERGLLMQKGTKTMALTRRSRERLEGEQGADQQDPLDPATILRLAGGPMPVEERRNCPKCDAVVSKEADRCPWCSASLLG